MYPSKHRIFVETVRCGSITATAHKLKYSQPGISHILQKLEKELGVQLLTRSKNGIALTTIGREFYLLFNDLLLTEDKISALKEDITHSIYGTVRICGFFSVLTQLIPSVIENVAKRYPFLKLELYEGLANEQLEKLDNDEVDIGITAPPVPKGYTFIPISDVPIGVVMHKRHPLARQQYIDKDELLNYHLLYQTDENAIELKIVFGDSYPELPFDYSSQSDYTLLRLVQKDLGIAVVSQLYARSLAPELTFRPLSGAYHTTNGIIFPKNKQLSQATRCFITVLCQMYQEKKYEKTSSVYILK